MERDSADLSPFNVAGALDPLPDDAPGDDRSDHAFRLRTEFIRDSHDLAWLTAGGGGLSSTVVRALIF